MDTVSYLPKLTRYWTDGYNLPFVLMKCHRHTMTKTCGVFVNVQHGFMVESMLNMVSTLTSPTMQQGSEKYVHGKVTDLFEYPKKKESRKWQS